MLGWIRKNGEVKGMNENQKQFLEELADLLEKYSVDDVRAFPGGISFESNRCDLRFDKYHKGRFIGCRFFIPEYATKYADVQVDTVQLEKSMKPPEETEESEDNEDDE